MKASTKTAMTFAFIVSVTMGLCSCSGMLHRSIINIVRNGYFYEEISDVTIGDMMETICTDSKWEYTPDENTGMIFVTYTGNMGGMPLVMRFFMVGGTFQLAAFSLNGEWASNGSGLTGRDELSGIPFALYQRYQRVKGR